MKTKKKFNIISKPKHYNIHPSKVEQIEISEAMTFCIGNAFKYVFRSEHKGTTIQDLKKAIWYLEHHLKLLAITEENFAERDKKIKKIIRHEKNHVKKEIFNTLYYQQDETGTKYAIKLIEQEIRQLEQNEKA